jgi:SAM-dependent methyltransferase
MSLSFDNEVNFWENRYLTGKTPWDFHGVPAALRRWLSTQRSPGRVLVPGCGSGYELKAFDDAGWDVTGIDYAPAAVARARAKVGFALGQKIVLADFFTQPFEGGGFDIIYERTFLCSIPPARWPIYVARMHELLVKKGKLVGFFLFGEEDDPPPYPLKRDRQAALFADEFCLETDEEVTDSLPLFAGHERWQIWRRTN